MVTAMVNDVQNNMTDYFDRACSGEDVFVPRTGNQNVFIISENEYKELQEARKATSFLSGLVSDDRRNREILARSVEELRLV